MCAAARRVGTDVVGAVERAPPRLATLLNSTVACSMVIFFSFTFLLLFFFLAFFFFNYHNSLFTFDVIYIVELRVSKHKTYQVSTYVV